ncbi:MAG: rod shape-determining protein MreC [Verrucomicrobia bacterium]|nr:MAG: rod shape-determining protein MreC [Verrucomicrobiota bacterium]
MRRWTPRYLVLALVAIILLALPERLAVVLKRPVREVLYPVQSGTTRIFHRLRETVAMVRGIGGLAARNRKLQSEVAWLRLRLRQLERLETENRKLREMLRFTARTGYDLIPAEVIGREASGWWSTVRIGAGSEKGIQRGAAVVTVDGLVGKVVEVSAHTADVLLLSDPSAYIPAVVPKCEAYGIVKGTGLPPEMGPTCEMEFVHREARIATGDEIITSGLGGVLPRGLLIGYAEQVTEAEGGLYQRVAVTPAANLDALTYVLVVERVSGGGSSGGQ